MDDIHNIAPEINDFAMDNKPPICAGDNDKINRSLVAIGQCNNDLIAEENKEDISWQHNFGMPVVPDVSMKKDVEY